MFENILASFYRICWHIQYVQKSQQIWKTREKHRLKKKCTPLRN